MTAPLNNIAEFDCDICGVNLADVQEIVEVDHPKGRGYGRVLVHTWCFDATAGSRKRTRRNELRAATGVTALTRRLAKAALRPSMPLSLAGPSLTGRVPDHLAEARCLATVVAPRSLAPRPAFGE